MDSGAGELFAADSYDSSFSTIAAELLNSRWSKEKAAPEILKYDADLVRRSRQQIPLMGHGSLKAYIRLDGGEYLILCDTLIIDDMVFKGEKCPYMLTERHNKRLIFTERITVTATGSRDRQEDLWEALLSKEVALEDDEVPDVHDVKGWIDQYLMDYQVPCVDGVDVLIFGFSQREQACITLLSRDRPDGGPDLLAQYPIQQSYDAMGAGDGTALIKWRMSITPTTIVPFGRIKGKWKAFLVTFDSNDHMLEVWDKCVVTEHVYGRLFVYGMRLRSHFPPLALLALSKFFFFKRGVPRVKRLVLVRANDYYFWSARNNAEFLDTFSK